MDGCAYPNEVHEFNEVLVPVMAWEVYIVPAGVPQAVAPGSHGTLIIIDNRGLSAATCYQQGGSWQQDLPLFTNERDFPVPSEPRPVRVAVYGNYVPRWRGKSFHQLT
jgi:hypothetical protein